MPLQCQRSKGFLYFSESFLDHALRRAVLGQAHTRPVSSHLRRPDSPLSLDNSGIVQRMMTNTDRGDAVTTETPASVE